MLVGTKKQASETISLYLSIILGKATATPRDGEGEAAFRARLATEIYRITRCVTQALCFKVQA
jgi:hypothetical protein